MTATVRTTGRATEKSEISMWRKWENIIAPTITRAAAATSVGTIDASGATNIAARNNAPVTRLARPVRAPSSMPAPDSMNTVFDDADAAPPSTAPPPSTIRAAGSRGKLPFASASPASRDSPVSVPSASKKLVNTRVKTSTIAAIVPMRLKLFRLNSPTRDKSGSANGDPVNTGTDSRQPPGLSTAEPRCQIASTRIAITVPATKPIRIPPRTRRATRIPVSSRVTTNTSAGIVVIDPAPPPPSPTGGDGSPVEPTKPASTRPMKRMNRPIPAVIANLS